MAQLFDAFDDAQGAAWARRAQDFTRLTDAFSEADGGETPRSTVSPPA